MSPMQVDPGRIVVFLPNWVGDAVMFTPTLRALRSRFQGAGMVLVGRAAPVAALTPNPWAGEAIVDAGGMLRLIGRLRRVRADLAVLGPNSFRSALLARLGGAGRRVGYDRDGRGWLLTDRLAPPRTPDGAFAVTPALEYYLKLAERLGCEVADRRMELDVCAGDVARAERLLVEAGAAGRPIVLMNPGAAFGGAKIYPPERMAAVADGLIRSRDVRIVINAAPAERPVARAVESAMSAGRPINLARVDNSLGLVKALVRRARLVITNDTGARHLAAAFGVPVVTIFGATHPGWARIDYEKERIVRVDVPCGPCQKKTCPLPAGPEHHQCMRKIPPEMVLAAAEELLDLEAPG